MTTTTRAVAGIAIGTPVRYWTGCREGDGNASRTRTEVQMLGGHTPVVWVEYEPSAIAVTHVEEITAEELAAAKAREAENAQKPVMCGNADHADHGRGPVPAVARVAWPDGLYRPTTGCKTDLRSLVNEAIRDGHSIHIDMIKGA